MAVFAEYHLDSVTVYWEGCVYSSRVLVLALAGDKVVGLQRHMNRPTQGGTGTGRPTGTWVYITR